MKQTKRTEDFESLLLSYVEMCYAVALALTRDPELAQDLARYALAWAWQGRNGVDGKRNIKHKLLMAVRENYLLDHTPDAGTAWQWEDALECAPGAARHAGSKTERARL